MGGGLSTLIVDYLAKVLAIETLIGQARDIRMTFEEKVQA